MSIQSTINQGLSLAGLLIGVSPIGDMARVKAREPEREAEVAIAQAKAQIAVEASKEKVENRLAAEAAEKERARQEDITIKTDLYNTASGLVGPITTGKTGITDKRFTRQLQSRKSEREAAISAAKKLYDVAPSSELHYNIGKWEEEIESIDDAMSERALAKKKAQEKMKARMKELEESNRIRDTILNPGGK